MLGNIRELERSEIVMAIRQGRGKLNAILLGIGLAVILVSLNGLAAFNFIPSSYNRFSWQAYADVVYTLQENTSGPQACSDLIDNDGDGLVDCQDPDCFRTLPCGAPAPVMSNPTLGLMAALLVLIGFFGLTPLRFGKRR